MNGHQEFSEQVAAELDSQQATPTEDLLDSVSRNGLCMWVRTMGMEPEWTGNDAVDRELAAPICAACPVQRECLELEFRSVDYATTGVWGPLPEHDRRAVYLAWSERREGGSR